MNHLITDKKYERVTDRHTAGSHRTASYEVVLEWCGRLAAEVPLQQNSVVRTLQLQPAPTA